MTSGKHVFFSVAALKEADAMRVEKVEKMEEGGGCGGGDRGGEASK